MSDDVIPPTEPQKPAKQQKKAKPARPGVTVAGSQLVPDLEQHRSAVETTTAYWLGTLPGAPVEHIDAAGINFPKVNEIVTKGPDGSTVRIPRIGAVVRLTADKLRRIQSRLSRTVIRFNGEAPVHEEPGTGQNVGAPHKPGRKGFLITIPTAEELKIREERGLAARRYQQQTHDEPAARYMFCVPCENQDKPEQGVHYPEPLEVTGLYIPEN